MHNENRKLERIISNVNRNSWLTNVKKLHTEAELQREKLLIEANSKDKERQVDKHRERELTRAEAEREMKLIQQLAEEKQKNALLQKEAEIQKLKSELAQKISEKENQNKILVQSQQAGTISEPVVQYISAQSISTLADLPAQPSMHVQELPVTQISVTENSDPTSTCMSTEAKSNSDQTPIGVYTLLNLPSIHSMGATSTKTNMNIASATQTVPTVLPITVTGNVSQPGNLSTNLVDLARYEVSVNPVIRISAAQISTLALLNSSNIMAVAPSVTSGDFKSRAVLPAVEAPVVVVKPMEQVKPYNGTSSHRVYRDYFERVCKVNNWVTNADIAQHLSLDLEGHAVELLRGTRRSVRCL